MDAFVFSRFAFPTAQRTNQTQSTNAAPINYFNDASHIVNGWEFDETCICIVDGKQVRCERTKSKEFYVLLRLIDRTQKIETIHERLFWDGEESLVLFGCSPERSSIGSGTMFVWESQGILLAHPFLGVITFELFEVVETVEPQVPSADNRSTLCDPPEH